MTLYESGRGVELSRQSMMKMDTLATKHLENTGMTYFSKELIKQGTGYLFKWPNVKCYACYWACTRVDKKHLKAWRQQQAKSKPSLKLRQGTPNA